jgi:hypothetical protein
MKSPDTNLAMAQAYIKEDCQRTNGHWDSSAELCRPIP